MCGLCGLLHLNLEKRADEALVHSMARIIRHRGPDDEGFHVEGPVGLGHRRLSIIDLSGGHQPISNEDDTCWIIFNGEIYNYRPLAEDLKSRGHVFKTRSDTETILHAYEEFGEDCVHRLRGMFAFAVWDSRKKKLFIARDRVGIKPLYYTVHDNTLYFGSEIKSFFQNPAIPRRMNLDALDEYLSFRYVPAPKTMFEGIYKLPPGGLMVVEDGKVNVRQYWDLQFRQTGEEDLKTWTEKFEQKIRESIDIRLMSEVPLGVFLSGGIDSSVVTAMMSGMLDEPVKSFSVGYTQKDHINEFPFARQVAGRYECDHRELEISPTDFGDFVPRLVWHLDEPVADSACVPLFFLSELTRKHVTVILSGEGADELLAGYYLYKKMLLIEKLRKLPALSQVFGLLGMIFPEGKLRKYLRQAALPLDRAYRGVSPVFTDEQRARLYPGSQKKPGAIQDFTESVLSRVPDEHPLNRMLYFDTRYWLPDDLLVKADKMTMASSLELRVPLLDHELMEMAASLPIEAKLEGNNTKRILRDIARPLLPPDILNRPKKGFPVPIQEWFAGDLSAFSRDSLLSPNSSVGDILDQVEIEEILRRHESGREDCSDRIWTLLVLEHWKRVYIDSAQAPDLGKPA
jgi:asparagine synthase (glutamine-hydrolysing)